MADNQSNSSLTSTSHTMSAIPPSPKFPHVSGHTQSSYLLDFLAPHNRHLFITPTSSIVDASLKLAKETLDYYATKLADEQEERLREFRKRKRGDNQRELVGQVLKIRKVHTQGFEVDTVWEQARRVIDALRGDVEGNLEKLEVKVDGGLQENAAKYPTLLQADEDMLDLRTDDDSAEEGQDEEQDSLLSAESSDDKRGTESEIEDDINDEDMHEDVDGGDELYDQDHEDDDEEGPPRIYQEDPHGLNDGFFSIDEFNKQTELLERLNASANPFSEETSDEEEIDWDADPSRKSYKSHSGSRQAKSVSENHNDSDKDDEEIEEGPTFGNMDLDAPSGESEEEGGEEEEGEDTTGDNTNHIMYKDFFEPPPRKLRKGERQADYLERQLRKSKVGEPGDEEASIERAISDVRRDLFQDESNDDSSGDALSELDPSDPKSRKSAHERKQAKLAEEIRRLEAASVAKREWMLAGEARAVDRPLNSLLEEDLDFERTGKPVLEVTAEVSESIEELIKRRILTREFDEVIRRRPDDLIKSITRRGAIELDDNKPQKSLADIYEEEHVKANNPDIYISKADEKLQNEEKEIEVLWKNLSAKLDALSSWYYKPRPAAPSLTVVSDVATVTIEDAQPTMASGINGSESMLAPQEIYKAGKDKRSIEKGEVVLKGGAPIARQEMTREEKLRRRRRAKERIAKRGGIEPNQLSESRKTKQNKGTLSDLKKGGVKVIGKKGDVRDLEGRKTKATAGITGASCFKL